MAERIPIAYFVSSHGFGHAARACAVMSAAAKLNPRLHFDVYTKAPDWFFAESLAASYSLHPVLTDIGVVQETPMQEDLPATLRALESFMPFDEALVEQLAQQLTASGARLLVCDIAPLGIAVAAAAGIPSVLIENFTWDWIYDGYTKDAPELAVYARFLRAIFALADEHIQARPVCRRDPLAALTTAPISRSPVTPREQMRARLGIATEQRMVLVTMGGIPERFQNLERVAGSPEIVLVIPGGAERVEVRDHVILLPHHSDYYHPDLIHASDAVVGKAGYSTVSEAYYTGVPFAYVARPSFRESAPLTAFIEREMSGFEMPLDAYQSGAWVHQLPALLALPQRRHDHENGADQAARFILKKAGV